MTVRMFVLRGGSETDGHEPLTLTRSSDGEQYSLPPGWLNGAGPDDLADFGVTWRDDPDPPAPPPPAPPPPSFLARDLMALLTPADLIAIDRVLNARQTNGDLTPQAAAFALLWSGMQAQAEAPIRATAERFRQGWAGIVLALGAERAAELAAALGIAEALSQNA